jgi:endonuclease/exonuclease/phosphatase family metal-dependent hydrolase
MGKTVKELMSLVCAAVILNLLWGSVWPPAQAEAAQDTELRLLCFNIRYGTARDGANHWQKRKDLVTRLIRDERSDVIGLQEALRFQIDYITEAVKGYGEIGVGRDDGRIRGEYCAILYCQKRYAVGDSGTFWLSDRPEQVASITWNNACTRICTWARLIEKASGRAFYVYNLHLDHVSQPSRVKSAVLVIERISQRTHDDPFVVMGDFNVGEKNPALLYLKGQAGPEGAKPSKTPLVDSFRVLHPQATDVGTFNGFRGRKTGSKIDYILAQPGAKVIESQIVDTAYDGRYPSDHFPVSAVLRWDGQ